jgi:aspartate aminotransferase
VAGRHVESTLDLAEVLLEEAKVAVVPGEAFGAPGYARLSYALSDEDLVEGITRIGTLLQS